MKHVTKAVAGIALASSVVLLSACSKDSDTATATPAASQGADSSSDKGSSEKKSSDGPTKTVPVDELVLPASEFPSGFTAQEVPKGPQLQQMVDSMMEQVKSGKVEPSNCVQMSLIPDSVDVNNIGMTVATEGATSTLSAVVAQEGMSLDEQRKQVTGDCANLTMEFTEGQLAGAKGQVHQTEVKPPKVDSDDVVVVDQDITMSVAGQTVHSKARYGAAEVNGYTVTVQYQTLDGSDINDDAFNKVFVGAVDRVAEKTS